MSVIEKDIPVPQNKGVYKENNFRARMEVGDSYTTTATVNGAKSSAYSWAKRNKRQWKWLCAQEGDLVRVWRIA